jgi:hypothetical protein
VPLLVKPSTGLGDLLEHQFKVPDEAGAATLSVTDSTM